MNFSNMSGAAVQELVASKDFNTRATFRAMVRRSLYFAVKTVTCYAFQGSAMPNLMTKRTHKEACDWLQWVVTTKKRGLFEDPRAHIKSTMSTITLPWWLATLWPDAEYDHPAEVERAARFLEDHPHLRGPDSRLGIVSESKQIATRWNASGRDQWTMNPVLRWAFPERVWPDVNKVDYGTFSREAYFLPGRSDPTHPNPYSRSIGLDSKESGGRVDGLIIDDMVSEVSFDSPTELYRRCNYVRSISQLHENSDYTHPHAGFTLVVENRWALDDPNTMIHREFDDWAIWRRSAHRCYVHNYGNCGRWTGDGETECADREEGIWPERYADLETVRREKGDLIYDIQWRNNPQAHPELAVADFKSFDIEVRDDGGRRDWFVVIPPERDDLGRETTPGDSFPLASLSHHYISVDPASADETSEARKRGKTARSCISWFALDKPTGRVFNIDIAAGHLTPDDTVSECYDMWYKAGQMLGFRPLLLWEKVAAQTYGISALKLYSQEQSRVRIDPTWIEGVPPARGRNKDMRIRQRFGWRLAQGKMYIRSGLQLPRSETRHFPNGSKDWLDTEAQVEEKYGEVHGGTTHTKAARQRKTRRRMRRLRGDRTGAPLG